MDMNLQTPKILENVQKKQLKLNVKIVEQKNELTE